MVSMVSSVVLEDELGTFFSSSSWKRCVEESGDCRHFKTCSSAKKVPF